MKETSKTDVLAQDKKYVSADIVAILPPPAASLCFPAVSLLHVVWNRLVSLAPSVYVHQLTGIPLLSYLLYEALPQASPLFLNVLLCLEGPYLSPHHEPLWPHRCSAVSTD